LAVVDAWAGFKTTLYSGASFLSSNLGGPGAWDRPLWIASYTNSGNPDGNLYPRGATFWQYTDHARFPGLPAAVDGSWYAQTARDLADDVRPAKAVAGPQKALQTLSVAPQADHDLEAFVEDANGRVWHRWQKQGRWQSWQSLGRPGG
jgi:GH25 family lysozyme M1 (1,4-beta-N-acetylmuramidase)